MKHCIIEYLIFYVVVILQGTLTAAVDLLKAVNATV